MKLNRLLLAVIISVVFFTLLGLGFHNDWLGLNDAITKMKNNFYGSSDESYVANTVFSQASLTFIILSLISIFSDKSEYVYWENVVEYRLISPIFLSFTFLSTLLVMCLVYEFIILTFFASLSATVIISFILCIIILIVISYRIITSFLSSKSMRNSILNKWYKSHLVVRKLQEKRSVIKNSNELPPILKEAEISKIEKKIKNETEQQKQCINTLKEVTVKQINNLNYSKIEENFSFLIVNKKWHVIENLLPFLKNSDFIFYAKTMKILIMKSKEKENDFEFAPDFRDVLVQECRQCVLSSNSLYKVNIILDTFNEINAYENYKLDDEKIIKFRDELTAILSGEIEYSNISKTELKSFIDNLKEEIQYQLNGIFEILDISLERNLTYEVKALTNYLFEFEYSYYTNINRILDETQCNYEFFDDTMTWEMYKKIFGFIFSEVDNKLISSLKKHLKEIDNPFLQETKFNLKCVLTEEEYIKRLLSKYMFVDEI